MYDNKMVHISAEEANKRILELKKDKDIFTVELDGKEISNWKEYIAKVEKIYKFPTKGDNFEGYNDWMGDLSWLNKKSYALFIYNFNEFMNKDLKSKKILLEIFENLLQWWSREKELVWYENCQPFNIYLID